MALRMNIYGILVNRVPEIREKYHNVRDIQTASWQRPIAWLYLAGLNLLWIFGWRGKTLKEQAVRADAQAEKLIARTDSESLISLREAPEELAGRLLDYDVISFDVFDTLLFRPFSRPEDLFYMVGRRLDYLDFKRLRMEAEEKARQDCLKRGKHCEVTLSDIYDRLEKDAGVPKEEGMRAELEMEETLCFANPYMREVFRFLHNRGKRIIILSDMYLPAAVICHMLKKCGFPEPETCLVSCEHGVSKSDGGLYRKVEKSFGQLKYVHIGDNPVSDGENAKKAGWDTVPCVNVNIMGSPFRCTEMSAVTGSVYRGLVNAHLHNGLQAWDRDYEYGFICGGIFVLGYCQFIHSYAKANGIEKILFLARDGDILSQVYRQLYPHEEAEGKIQYVLWSRLAAVKMTARYYKYDYFRRFLFHKVNQGFTLEQILETMELTDLLDGLTEEGRKLDRREPLTDKNVQSVREYLNENWEIVLSHYEMQIEEGGRYYKKILAGCQKAAAVDIGWAGSGAMALDVLVSRVWKMDCEITGILAGTNTCHNAEPDMSEAQLSSGKLVSYLFSQAHNRDLWNIHDAAKGDNVALERLLASPFPGFRGFIGLDWEEKAFCPGTGEESAQARRIQKGILDFCWLYKESGAELCINSISGRDAAAPAYLWMMANRKETAKTDIQCVLA